MTTGQRAVEVESACKSYISLGLSAFECEREHSHGGMHHFDGLVMSLDGAERRIVVSWSDYTKATHRTATGGQAE